MAKREKTGGREKGTPNKVTRETRDLIQSILAEEIPNLRFYIQQIERPEIKAKLIIELLPYVLPKFSNIGLDITQSEPIIRGISEIEIIHTQV